MKVWIRRYWDAVREIFLSTSEKDCLEEIGVSLCLKEWIRAGGPVPKEGQTLICDVTIKPWNKRRKK